jgi:hypothetical protein
MILKALWKTIQVWMLSLQQADPIPVRELKPLWLTVNHPDWADADSKTILNYMYTFKKMMENPSSRKFKPMMIDPSARSADPDKPAFMSPPPGAKPYHGFFLIPETAIDGFTFGAITDFLHKDTAGGCTWGDGFVEAPDGTRAGIVWEVSDQVTHSTVVEPDDERWGVFRFTVLRPVNSVDDLRENFASMLPTIKVFYAQAKGLA